MRLYRPVMDIHNILNRDPNRMLSPHPFTYRAGSDVSEYLEQLAVPLEDHIDSVLTLLSGQRMFP